MANEEHLRLLRQGVEAWNKWREENPDVRPELDGADLSNTFAPSANLSGANLMGAQLSAAFLPSASLTGADLRKAFLPRAFLSEADLRLANLGGAFLGEARLRNARLCEADLMGSHLFGADLHGADLREAKLSEGDLMEASLIGTNLGKADLSGAFLYSTVFGDVDLSVAVGLEQVHHAGPSTIGIDTLYRSKGHIPEVFLRGCGVPDSFIEYARSLALAERPIDYYSCFISYSSANQDFADHLYADLQANGVRCWFAPEDMPIGARIRVAIDEAIRTYDKLLLVLSEKSVSSDWVEQEVEAAFEKERKEQRLVLFPVRLDDAVMHEEAGWAAHLQRSRNIGDFRQWKDHDAYQKAFQRVLRDLKAGRSSP